MSERSTNIFFRPWDGEKDQNNCMFAIYHRNIDQLSRSVFLARNKYIFIPFLSRKRSKKRRKLSKPQHKMFSFCIFSGSVSLWQIAKNGENTFFLLSMSFWHIIRLFNQTTTNWSLSPSVSLSLYTIRLKFTVFQDI